MINWSPILFHGVTVSQYDHVVPYTNLTAEGISAFSVTLVLQFTPLMLTWKFQTLEISWDHLGQIQNMWDVSILFPGQGNSLGVREFSIALLNKTLTVNFTLMVVYFFFFQASVDFAEDIAKNYDWNEDLKVSRRK